MLDASADPRTGVDFGEGERLSGLRINPFSGCRTPLVYRDWKKNVEAVRFISDLNAAKLAVVAWLSLRGDAKDHVRHIPSEDLKAPDSSGLTHAWTPSTRSKAGA